MANLGLGLVLREADDYLHVGLLAQLLPHYGADTAQQAQGLQALQLYNENGTRFAFDEAGTLAPGADVDPGLLVDRIAVVMAKAQVKLHATPSATLGTRLPSFDGPLPAVLAGLAAYFEPLQPVGPGEQESISDPHVGGPFHNWLHSIGLA